MKRACLSFISISIELVVLENPFPFQFGNIIWRFSRIQSKLNIFTTIPVPRQSEREIEDFYRSKTSPQNNIAA
jgi:hypothetical protein